MRRTAGLLSALAAGHAVLAQNDSRVDLLTDIDIISRYWGQISPYRDNAADVFGVSDIGLPDGCQIEQAHTLQRHADRLPGDWADDGPNSERFAEKVSNHTKQFPDEGFKGPLAFLNSYRYQLGNDYLTGKGAATEFQAGVSFWNQYGRILYDASLGQLQYNGSYSNGTQRPKPVLRTTNQSRMQNSQINWALGFFGVSYYETPDPMLGFCTDGSLFDTVVIPEGENKNNTLAAYDACFADQVYGIGDIGDNDRIAHWTPLYLADATARLQQYAPEGFQFTVNDTYAMQSTCAYEIAYIASSDLCGLFTEAEWAGFEHAQGIGYYYDYGAGNPTGRAQGLGYAQELLSRLLNQPLTTSNSSANSTLDSSPETFPLGAPFYADFTHDDIIISVLAALSVDYFRDAPSLRELPLDPERRFRMSRITPFGAKLVTEVIGCADPNPSPVRESRTFYYPSQYGYDASNAPHKFVRMRLNNGLVPLDSIRGGRCEGRSDGMCELSDFVASQAGAEELANYNFACFANYTLSEPLDGHDYDGRVDESTPGVVVHPGRLDE
ncbi:hypothetical protein WHR41_05236 [Cladosporium halotolerans]|uniref:Phosphoglycerate mutase-like protein n=1 Tax=Cladosporium halotolerans TaxID=1052096 RepID=A0AB34KS99_9PEZI